jgi:hypothetical protein
VLRAMEGTSGVVLMGLGRDRGVSMMSSNVDGMQRTLRYEAGKLRS